MHSSLFQFLVNKQSIDEQISVNIDGSHDPLSKIESLLIQEMFKTLNIRESTIH